MAPSLSELPHHSLGPAELDFSDGGAPRSRVYNDTYFDSEDGLGESRHIFIHGCRLPQMWQDCFTFVIGELGFGTGLNFLAAWQAWKDAPRRPHRLHFLSVEGFPLSPSQINKALAAFPELSPLAAQLLNAYPDPQPGFHRLEFESGQIALTLLLGPVLPTLKSLDARVDTWFLDGFAPDRNPEMWHSTVLCEVARLSRTGTRLATFTVAGQVRRDLESQGFKLEKGQGWRKKREVLAAEFTGPLRSPAQEPWYRSPLSGISAPRDVAIIGSGLAGAAAAHAFSKRGCKITVVEAHEEIADGASATPTAVMMPRLTADHSVDGQFYALAWRMCLDVLDDVGSKGFDLERRICGSLRLAGSAGDEKRQTAIFANGLLPTALLSLLSAKEASKISGLQLNHSGLFFPQGGTVSPRRLCEALLKGSRVLVGRKCTSLLDQDNRWRLVDENSQEITTADIVVLACSLGSKSFRQSSWLPIRARLGQVSQATPSPSDQALRCVIAGDGYIAPTESGTYTIGATFDHVSEATLLKGVPAPTREADDRNFNLVRNLAPGLLDACNFEDTVSWTGVRCTTSDHLPLAGALPDHDAYLSDFADLRHGHRWSQYPDPRYHNGLGVLTGLGAHGVVLAPLAAEFLASQMLGEPSPLPRAVANGLHPGRFIVRNLKRRKP